MSDNSLKKTTKELDAMLENSNWDNISKILRENEQSMEDSDRQFYYYMKDTIESKGFRLNEVYIAAGFDYNKGSDILEMHRHTPNRDKILRLCIAAHFNLEEINKALKLYGMKPLYSKDRRDFIIISAVQSRVFDIGDIDATLINEKLTPLLSYK